jgi:hypothetical protein
MILDELTTHSHLQPLTVHSCRYVAAQYIRDGNDGELNVLTTGRELPFEVKRIYYIRNITDVGAIRGKHAHKCLEQAMFCVSGSFILLLDDGMNQQQIYLTADYIGVYIGPKLWHTMQGFSSDCVIVVLANAPYDESDYIRNYDDFKRYTSNNSIH